MGKRPKLTIKTTCVALILILSMFNHVSTTNSQSNGIYFSTLFGGPLRDNAKDVALDENGNIFMAGDSEQLELDPITKNFTSPQTELSGNKNVFITEYSSQGELISKIILGGSDDDEIGSIMFDSLGNLIAVGWTTSLDFPALDTEFTNDPLPGNVPDAIFITKFSRSLEMLWSIVIGGSSFDIFGDAKVDGVDNIIVALSTDSDDFPTLYGNSPDPNNETLLDSVVFKLSPSGQLMWSTYVIGEDIDMVIGIAIDDENSVYLTGATRSIDFPGREDENTVRTRQYVVKLLTNGEPNWFYVGGWVDIYQGRAIIVDPNDRTLLIAGHASSQDFPGSETTSDSEKWFPFITKFSLDGEILWSSQYPNKSEFPIDIIISQDNSIYLTGFYYPTIEGQIRPINAFISKLSSQGELIANASLGGVGTDKGNGLVNDNEGRLIIVGETSSTDFPLYNPLDSTISASDAFLTIIGDDFLTLQQTPETTSQYRIPWTLLPILLVITLQTTFRRRRKSVYH